MEFCNMSLRDVINDLTPGMYYREFYVGSILCKLAHGLHVLHREGYVHRDIKPENILFTDCSIVVFLSQLPGEAKWSDFGLAKLYDPAQENHTWCGTPAYFAPEGPEKMSQKFDIYSFGLCIYEMMTRKRYSQGDRGETGRYYSKALWSLIESMLSFDPNDRPTALEIAKISGSLLSNDQWNTFATYKIREQNLKEEKESLKKLIDRETARINVLEREVEEIRQEVLFQKGLAPVDKV